MTSIVTTVICCEICDKRVINIPGTFEYIDHAGIITARCADHADPKSPHVNVTVLADSVGDYARAMVRGRLAF